MNEPGGPIRIMLDTNVFDRIADTPGLTEALNQLSAAQKLHIFSTPVQEQELAEVPDPARRRRLDAIRRTVIPVPNSAAAPSAKHLKDALIGAAAAHRVDVLVTEDLDFARRVQSGATPTQVWRFRDLIKLMRSQ